MKNLPLAYNVTFVGLVVVFSSLIILSFLIFLFTNIVARSRKKLVDAASSDDAAALELDEEEPSVGTAYAESDEELVAVITAAIYASGYSHPNVKLHVKSYRRIPCSSPVWNTVGRKEQINAKL